MNRQDGSRLDESTFKLVDKSAKGQRITGKCYCSVVNRTLYGNECQGNETEYRQWSGHDGIGVGGDVVAVSDL